MISFSSGRSETEQRNRLFSASSSFSRFSCSPFRPLYSDSQRKYVTSVTPVDRMAPRDQNINLSKLSDDLFLPVSLP